MSPSWPNNGARADVARARRAVRALAVAIAALVMPAFACGPYFPPELLNDRDTVMLGLAEGTFDFEASRLAAKPTQAFKPVENPWEAPGESRTALEKTELGEAGYARVEAMRLAGSDAAAWKAGESLPDEVRLYSAGARAFHAGEYALARQRFAAVLALPDAERVRRGLWAQYMLGRLDRDAVGGAGVGKELAAAKTASATEAFQSVRAAVQRGAADPLGLAVASYGEEAALYLSAGNTEAAVALYAQQAALGSDAGRSSLLILARRQFADADRLAAAMKSPLLQPLLAAYVYTRSDEFGTDARPPGTALERYYAAIEAADPATMLGVDRVAAAAYRAGRFDLAGKLAARSEAPLALWVRAKLALRRGDTKAAADAYAQASHAFPRDEDWGAPPEAEYAVNGFHPACRVDGERAVLALNRGDYVEALRLLHAGRGDYWTDEAYVAERVLDIDELKRYVDAEVPEPRDVAKPDEAAPDETGWVAPQPDLQLRELLGRRLMRAGRYAEAVAYFGPALRGTAQAYAQARAEAVQRRGIERAEQLFAAARLARGSGMEILGTELDPDGAVYDGAYEYAATDYTAKPASPFVGSDEIRRYAATRTEPNARYHYRRVAADLANQAADLVPPRSQAFAALLCSATGWLINRDYPLARTYYLRYVKHGPYVPWAGHYGNDCPAPDFPGAAKRLRAEQIAWAKRQARAAAPWAAVAMLVAGIGILVWRRRRGNAANRG